MSEGRHLELEWLARDGASGYRVIVTDETAGTIVLDSETGVHAFAVPSERIDLEHRYRWQVLARENTNAPWSTVLPPLLLLPPTPDHRRTTVVHWSDAGDPAYRFVLWDETTATFVVDEGVDGTTFPIDWEALEPLHSFRYRVDAWRNGDWRSYEDYRQIEPPIGRIVASLAEREPEPASDDCGELLFLYTVDTEINIRRMRSPDRAHADDHQIFCMHDGRDFGIGMMMELLDGVGFKATFFLDILLEHQFGRRALQRTIDAIQDRGHDIQLHLHTAPNLYFARAARAQKLVSGVASGDADLFRESMELAIDLFERRVGKRPVAYRSGAYHLHEPYLEVLSELGIHIDTSLFAYKNCHLRPWMRARTQPFWVGDVLEIPVSWLANRHADRTHVTQYVSKPMRGSDLAGAELLRPQPGAPPGTLVYMAHSWSLLSAHEIQSDAERAEWNEAIAKVVTPEQYRRVALPTGTRGTRYGEPEHLRVAAFARMLAFLASRPGMRGVSFQQLHDEGLHRWPRQVPTGSPFHLWHDAARSGELAWTRSYSRSFLEHLEAEAGA